LLKIGKGLPKFDPKPKTLHFGFGFDDLIYQMQNVDPVLRPSTTEAIFLMERITKEIQSEFGDPANYKSSEGE
jgi:hypothetical protein